MSFFSDTFTDAAGTALTSHTPSGGGSWSGAASVVVSDANRCRTGTGSAGVSCVGSGAPATTEYDVEADATLWSLTGIDTLFTGLYSHAGTDTTDQTRAGYQLVFERVSGSWAIRLKRYFASSLTALAATTAGTSWNTGGGGTSVYHLKLTTRSSGGNLVVSGYVTDSTGQYLKPDGTWQAGAVAAVTATDTSPLSAGKAGVVFYDTAPGNSSGIHLDNFAATDLAVALAAGVVSRGTVTAAAVGLAATDATGGTAPYSYQWQRSATAAGTYADVAGQTSLTLSDATAVAGTTYWYRLRYTDSAGTPGVVYSNLFPAQLWQAPAVLGFIGDSLWQHNVAGVTIPDKVVAYLNRDSLRRRVWTLGGNQAHSSAHWSDWEPGAGTGYLSTAKAAFGGAGVTHVVVMLGTNLESLTNMLASAAAVEADLLAAGYKVVYCGPPWSSALSAANLDDIRALTAGLAARANGTTVFMADRTLFEDVAANPTWLSDGVHLDTATGSDEAAIRQAAGISYALDVPAAPPRVRHRLGLRR